MRGLPIPSGRYYELVVDGGLFSRDAIVKGNFLMKVNRFSSFCLLLFFFLPCIFVRHNTKSEIPNKNSNGLRNVIFYFKTGIIVFLSRKKHRRTMYYSIILLLLECHIRTIIFY